VRQSWPPTRPDDVTVPPPAALDPARSYLIRLHTNCGVIVIALNVRGAPHATAQIADLVTHGVLDDAPFYRVARGQLIQGGLRSLGVLASVPTVTDRTPPPGSGYASGTVAMYHSTVRPPGSGTSDFFIVTGPNGLAPRFAVLGHVTAGAAVARQIATIPSRPAADGEPLLPVIIDRAELVVR
jgi:cyclophilin family peptidyl-prolyl cis-trans isomerase